MWPFVLKFYTQLCAANFMWEITSPKAIYIDLIFVSGKLLEMNFVLLGMSSGDPIIKRKAIFFKELQLGR